MRIAALIATKDSRIYVDPPALRIDRVSKDGPEGGSVV